jgi:hypothetical protein
MGLPLIGYQNEWGALVEQEVAVQKNLQQTEKEEKYLKQRQFKETLDQQLHAVRSRVLQRDNDKYSFKERHVLEQAANVKPYLLSDLE